MYINKFIKKAINDSSYSINCNTKEEVLYLLTYLQENTEFKWPTKGNPLNFYPGVCSIFFYKEDRRLLIRYGFASEYSTDLKNIEFPNVKGFKQIWDWREVI